MTTPPRTGPRSTAASASGVQTHYDAIVIGGGHNGLVAGAYLARAGKRVVVLERREVVGGAAVTETPFGPDYRVSTLSYVVSLLPASVVRELELERHGYRVHRQHGYFVPYPDGRTLQLSSDRVRRRDEVAKFSARDANAIDHWDEWLGRAASVLGPLLSAVPPTIGSRRLPDMVHQARFAWRLRDLGPRTLADVTRLLMMSVADLVEEFFESEELRGVHAVSGIIGTWGGPRSPGTAAVLAHHKIGDAIDGQPGAWGFPHGGMGALTGAIAAAASRFGADIRTNAAVAKIIVRGGETIGVALEDGAEIRAPIVVTTVHPKTAFLRFVDRTELPADFVNDIARWRTRSGTVKLNVAVDRLPDFRGRPGFHPEVHGGTIVLARSVDALETAFQDAVAGRGAAEPFADVCIPSVFDSSLAPPGHHIVSLFTQWVPHAWAVTPKTAELDAFADRVIASLDDVAPGFTSSILHRQVIGPFEMEHTYGLVGGNIFHGELSPHQLFHLRPAVGYADFTTPIRGLYQAGSATHGGGGVSGIPAVNAVRRILRDERHSRWKRGGPGARADRGEPGSAMSRARRSLPWGW